MAEAAVSTSPRGIEDTDSNSKPIAATYGEAIRRLASIPETDIDSVVESLLLRDRTALATEKLEIAPQDVRSIVAADETLKKILRRLKPGARAELRKVADSLQAGADRWWWQAATGREPNLRATAFTTAVWIAGAVSVIYDVEIIRRFWAGGIDVPSVVIQAILSLAATGTVVTAIRSWLVDTNGQTIPTPVSLGFLTAGALIAIGFLFALPSVSRHYNNAGLSLKREGRYAAAATAFERAAQLAPTDVAPRYNLGALYEQMFRADKARESYLACIAASDTKTVGGRRELFLSCTRLAYLGLHGGDPKAGAPFAQAALTLRTAFAGAPEDSRMQHLAWRNYGWAQLALGAPRSASDSLAKALDYDDTPEERYLLARTEAALKKVDAARDDFRTFLSDVDSAGRFDLDPKWIEEAKTYGERKR